VTRTIDTAIFDLGGVIMRNGSPADLARRFPGLDPAVVLDILMGPYHEDTDHPWHRLERGEVTMAEARAANVAAFEAAIGGTLCVRRSSLPRDFASVVALLREPSAAVQLVIGADRRDARHAFLTVPAPVHIPSLKARASELPRIVDEYARDAAAELSIRDVSFSETDRRWVLEHAATSLSEIEKATLRLVALKISTSATQAAARLGMAAVSLSRWVGRRKLPPTWVAAAAVRTAKR
jgi:hypothetical protein